MRGSGVVGKLQQKFKSQVTLRRWRSARGRSSELAPAREHAVTRLIEAHLHAQESIRLVLYAGAPASGLSNMV